MEGIIMIKGKVKFPITLDPSVWIFDDRKIDLDTYTINHDDKVKELEEYKKAISKHWDREITEGAISPTTVKTEKKYLKEKLLSGSFGMVLKPFLLNAEPFDNVTKVIIERTEGEVELPIEEALEIILAFSHKGKPLKDDGPVHIYYKDFSNRTNPIKNVTGFRLQ